MEEMVREYLAQLPMGPLAVCLLVGAALLEYVFPPFPGDTAVLAGAFLVGSADWDPFAVLAAVNVGSLAGILLDYEFGRFVQKRDEHWRKDHPRWAKIGRTIDKIMPLFEKRPEVYLVANRFLPSIRAFFFIAAGMAEYPRWKVLVLGGISAFCWCLLIFFVGWWIGNDWDRLVQFFSNYQRLAWVLIGAVILWIVYRVWKGKEIADDR